MPLKGEKMSLLQKTSTVEAIVNLLMTRINNGFYRPGDKLPSERVLQDEMAVGRLALREALSRLNAMGIIATAHGRGTYVQDDVKSQTFRDVLVPYFALSSPKRLQDLVVARGMLESEIAGLAAQQRTTEQLNSLIEVVNYTFPTGIPPQDVARQDLLFHRMLADIIDNSFLAKMHEALVDHIKLFLGEYVKSKKSPKEVIDAHRPILRAIEQQDVDAARYQARMHVSFGVQDYEEYVQRSLGDQK